MGDERDALLAVAARLEAVAARIEEASDEILEALAAEALALSEEIAERLPRALREAEAPLQEGPEKSG